MSKKTVLITGAIGGIGLAAATLFARSKNIENLFLIDTISRVSDLVSMSNKLTLLRKRRVNGFVCDITRQSDINGLFDKPIPELTNIDILINVAGIAPANMTPLVKTDISAVRKIMDVNFWGTLNMCKAVLPLMQANGYGRIVNVSSISALMADPGNLVYSASKAAVIQLTRALAKEAPFNKNGPPHDITVNAVAPGIVDTPMAKQLSEKMIENFKAAAPLGRLITPEEVAEVIYWLAAEAPQSVTGTVVRVDGGFLA